MATPFDVVIGDIAKRGYHSHRTDDHSDVVSVGIWADLLARCPAIKNDHDDKVISHWLNVRAPGGRERKIDLFIGEPGPGGKPDLSKIRIGIENKSVVTAHRNRDARFDDLSEVLAAIYQKNKVAVLAATVLVGVAERVLNVPDRIKTFHPDTFDAKIKPRLSTGDEALWKDFATAISKNRQDDPAKTVKKFRQLPTRSMAHTHVEGYDYLLLVPVFVDNVNPPKLPRPNSLGIDVDKEYETMLTHICKAYQARWHP